MKFKDIFSLIPSTKIIGVVDKDKLTHKYTVLYRGVAIKCPKELCEYELTTITITTDYRTPILTIGVEKEEETNE